MSILIAELGNWVAGATFVISYILILQRKQLTRSAAVLYAIGTFTGLASFAYFYCTMLLINVAALNDSGPNYSFPLLALLVPAGALAYAILSIVLLRPSISQEAAIYYGRMVHISFPLLFIVFFALPPGNRIVDVKWLVYGLLWFRIRDAYAKPVS